MPFKLDENLPAEAATLLQAAGHDVQTVHTEGLAGAADSRRGVAVRAERRALVTLDFDFADIRAYPPPDYAGIVVLWPHTQDVERVLGLLSRSLPVLEDEGLEGKLCIVEEDRVRFRE
jgi:predicted nuclease of predicted toxin-antitoxin system